MMKYNVKLIARLEWKDHRWRSITIFPIDVQFLCDDAWTLRIVLTYCYLSQIGLR